MGIIYNSPKQKRLRQQGIGRYVVDFYCPAKKVAIEIDGATHWTEEERGRDRDRQRYIEALNICELRFTNDDVYTNKDGVLNAILAVLEDNEDES